MANPNSFFRSPTDDLVDDLNAQAAKPITLPDTLQSIDEDAAPRTGAPAKGLREVVLPTDRNLPAGMRNNNPGNIKYVGQRDAIGPSENRDQGDPQAVYATPEDGMAAMFRLALRKYDGGKTSANDLIASRGGWTPGNTQAAANVARTMGLSPDDDLNLRDPAMMQKFGRALMLQEHGPASHAYSDDMIANVADSVASGKRPRTQGSQLQTLQQQLDADEQGRYKVIDQSAPPDLHALQQGLDADEAGRYKVLPPDFAATHFSPALMDRGAYEQTFRQNNPGASDAAVAYAMGEYDKQAAQRAAAPSAADTRFKMLNSPEAMFDQRLNAKLAGRQNGIVPALPDVQAATAQPTPEQPPLATEGNIATDTLKNLKLGADIAAQDLREAVGRLPGGQKALEAGDAIDRYFHPEVKDSGELLSKDSQQMINSMSPETRAAMAKKWWDSDKGTFGSAWSDPRAYLSGIVQSLPEQAMTMVPSMALAKAAYAAKIAAGLGEAAAAASAARTAMVAGALSEGTLGGAQSSREVREAVLQLKPEVLAQSDAYQALLNGGMTADAAKKALADDLATRAFVTSGIVTGMFGGMGDRAIAKLFTEQVGKASVKQALGAFGKGALAEGLFEELPQSAGQQLAQNEAIQHADPNRKLSEDVANQAIGGAVLGGLQGGAMGAGAHGRGHVEAPVEEAAPGAAAQPATPPVVPPTQVPAVPAAAAPAPKSSAPLTTSLEHTAEQPQRVVAVTPDGQQAAGTVQAYHEDRDGGFTAQILGDDGQVYTVTDEDGLQLVPVEAPQGPLTASLEATAEQHAAVQAPAEPPAASGVPGATEGGTPSAPVAEAAPAVPERAPTPTAPADMSDEQLRTRMQYLAGQFKGAVDRGVQKKIALERRAIEKEINARSTQGVANVPAEQPVTPGSNQTLAPVEPTHQAGATPAVQLDAAQDISSAGRPAASMGQGVADDSGAAVASPALTDQHAGKEFASNSKARAYIAKQRIGATHFVKRIKSGEFEIRRRPGAGATMESAADKISKQEEAVRQAAKNIAARAAAKAAQAPQTTFKTAKGSVYAVNDDGSTTRNKAARPEHPGDQGIQEPSQTTFYVDDAGLNALGEFQTQGSKKRLAKHRNGMWGVQYEDGNDAGKFERRSMTDVTTKPAVGMYPVEIWKDGRVVHFGNKITEVNGQTEIDTAAHEAATSPTNELPEPTAAQKEAGNYKKGHIQVHGMDITVENPRGSTRSGQRQNGTTWSHEMSDHYGYIKRTEGADGEQIDVYVGPKPESNRVFVVDQLNQGDGSFDEHKAMLGYGNKQAALRAYKSNFDKGWKVGPVRQMSVDEFKAWIKEGDTTRPVAEHQTEANPTIQGERNGIDQHPEQQPHGAKAVEREQEASRAGEEKASTSTSQEASQADVLTERRRQKAKADKEPAFSVSGNDDYRDEHRAPGREDGAPLSDLTGEGTIYPDDVYSANGPRYYGTGKSYDREAFRIANQMRGKPDAEVTIYRAIPGNIAAEINPGDWVAITKQYAMDHGESRFDGDYKIISKKVRASDIFTNGDSIQEWGYDPENGERLSTADDPASAIQRLMADKTGEATVHVPGVGEVTIPYGDSKSGLAHIARRRGENFLSRVADLLQHGTVYEKEGQKGRVFLGHGVDEAVLSLDRNGKAGTWLLSAYEKYPDLKAARLSEVTEERMPEGQYFTKDDLHQSLTSRGILGQVIASMIDAGVVKLHGGPNKLPGKARGVKGVQAVTMPDGTIHMVASNLTPRTAFPVLMHEMFHQGGEKLIGTKEWGNLMGRLGSLYRQSEQSGGKAREFYDRARARVEAARSKGAVGKAMEVEEFAAYAIEEYEKAPESLPAAIRKWVEDLIGFVKAWAVQRFGKQLGQVTPAQLAAFARWALMDVAVERRGEIFGPLGAVFSAVPDETRAEPVELTPPEQGPLRRLQSAVQDNMSRVKQVQDRITKLAGRTVGEKSDYYLAETNRPGRIAARLEDAQTHLFAPLMERLAKSGYTMEQLSSLLHAQHAEERNAAVAKINPAFGDTEQTPGSGMADSVAQEIQRQHAGDTELLAIAQTARDIARATLDLKQEYGLLSQEKHDELAKMYEHYVPLKGDGEYGPKIKRAMGHEEREEHILENIARDYQQAVVTGEKNLARQSLLRLILQHIDPSLWTVGVPPRGRYVAGKVYNIFKGNEQVASFTSAAQAQAFLEAKGAHAGYTVRDSGGEQVKEFAKPLQDNEIMVYVKGEPVRIQIHDEKLARQLRPIIENRDLTRWFVDKMRALNRFKAMIYTGKNPAFIPRNMARDAMTGTVNMTGHYGAKVAAQSWAKYPAAFASMLQYARGKATGDEMGGYLTEYRQHGGKVGASHMSDLEAQGKTLQRLFDDAYGAGGFLSQGRVGKASWVASRKLVGRLSHAIEIANQAAENALRLGLYATLREQGLSPAKAAQAAKTVTVDFDRKGEATGLLGAAYLFINPAIQGTANMIKTMAQGEHKAQAWALVGAITAAGLAAAGAGMDDDKERWLGASWDTRSKNLILRIGGHPVQIPVSQEYAPFYAAGVAIGEARRGESAMKSSLRLFSSFLDAYFPLQGAFHPESDNHAADLALSLVPTAIRPHVETAFNRNGFGSQIVPENEQTKDRPDNLKMNRSTKNSLYDKAAQKIAEAGVGVGYAGKYENDITKVSPETLKYLWRTYTGGLGQFITDTAGLAALMGEDPKQVESSDIPIVKDFVKTDDAKPLRSRYYELAKDAQRAASEFKLAAKAGDSEALDKLLADQQKEKLISLAKMVTSTNKAAATLADEKVNVAADDNLSGAQKREKLKELEKQEEALYREAIDAFK